MRARLLEALGVVIAYTAVGVFATWPLARDPLGGFYGFGNDNWGGMPYLGWFHDADLGSESSAVIPELQAPFGLTIPNYAIQPFDRLMALLFGGFDQGLGAYNAQIFLSFVLAGCTMYLLARYVTGSRLAALVAGFAFTFSPFHLAFAMQYSALAGIQWVRSICSRCSSSCARAASCTPGSPAPRSRWSRSAPTTTPGSSPGSRSSPWPSSRSRSRSSGGRSSGVARSG